MSEQGSCVHIKISYRTKVDGGGYTTGWWECDSNCGMKFIPKIIVAQLEAEIERFQQLYSDLQDEHLELHNENEILAYKLRAALGDG